jgi:hypothetical protein
MGSGTEGAAVAAAGSGWRRLDGIPRSARNAWTAAAVITAISFSERDGSAGKPGTGGGFVSDMVPGTREELRLRLTSVHRFFCAIFEHHRESFAVYAKTDLPGSSFGFWRILMEFSSRKSMWNNGLRSGSKKTGKFL